MSKSITMAPTPPKVALSECQNASDAVRIAFADLKARSSAASLAYVCAKAGIASRGYLSQIMSGSKRVGTQYRDSLPHALGLKGSQARFLKLLIDLDNTRTEVDRLKITRKLDLLRKSLDITKQALSGDLAQTPSVAEVFCAFGMFGNRATEEDLVDVFGKRQETTVTDAIDALLRHGFIRADGLHYEIVNPNIMYHRRADATDPDEISDTKGLDLADFVYKGTKDASKQFHHWFAQSQRAHFESSIISVRQNTLEALLPLLRDAMSRQRMRLESDDADTLIRFNVQIYPIVAKNAFYPEDKAGVTNAPKAKHFDS